MGKAKEVTKAVSTTMRKRTASESLNTPDRDEALKFLEDALASDEEITNLTFYKQASYYDYTTDPAGRKRMKEPKITYQVSVSSGNTEYDDFIG